MAMARRTNQSAPASSPTDAERIDWLGRRIERCREVYWHIENEGGTVREAIDWLTEAQRDEDTR